MEEELLRMMTGADVAAMARRRAYCKHGGARTTAACRCQLCYLCGARLVRFKRCPIDHDGQGGKA